MKKTWELHKSVPLKVWADIDIGIADEVRNLNKQPGVRTYWSCQGGQITKDKLSARYLVVGWRTKKAFKYLQHKYGDKLRAHRDHKRVAEYSDDSAWVLLWPELKDYKEVRV